MDVLIGWTCADLSAIEAVRALLSRIGLSACLIFNFIQFFFQNNKKIRCTLENLWRHTSMPRHTVWESLVYAVLCKKNFWASTGEACKELF